MPSEERALYIKNGWDTRQVKEASADLAYSTREVLDSLIPLVQQIDPELGPVEGAEAIRDIFRMDYIPHTRRDRWGRSERWVFRFLSDYSFRNTPITMDRRIQNGMERVDFFESVQDALDYWYSTLSRIDRRLARLKADDVNTLLVADRTYVDSRVVRFATKGYYLAPSGTFILVEN